MGYNDDGDDDGGGATGDNEVNGDGATGDNDGDGAMGDDNDGRQRWPRRNGQRRDGI